MALGAFVVKVVKAVLFEIIKRIVDEQNIIERLVKEPVKSIIQGVVNGSWRGDGADRFVDEMTRITVPMIEDIVLNIAQAKENVNLALNDIEEADKAQSQQALALGQEFKNVYA